MRRLSPLLICVSALGLAASFPIGATPSAAVSAAAAAKPCPRGSVPAVIRGSRRCLRPGLRCFRRDDRRYHRYGFHCHSGRLTRRRPPASRPGVTVMAAGDIACEPGDTVTATRCHQRQTSNLLDDPQVDAVLTLGDNQYEDGRYSEFTGRQTYADTWGRKKAITRPAPGNHEYHISGADGYFDYFGAAAGARGKGYYSFNLGSWHLIALNSEISASAGSAQEQWLRSDLGATAKKCILAYWHKPRFSSGGHGSTTSVSALWQALYRAHADVVLTAHDHDYERFALQGPSGQANASGIREFVVGTGGASHSSFSSKIEPNSQIRNASTYGVLKLSLHSGSYEWKFVPEAGGTFTDSGATQCH
jgi:hypothetical protein